MAARSKSSKPRTAFLTTQEEATPDEIAKVKTRLHKAANNLYGSGEQLSAKEVETISTRAVRLLHTRPPGHR